MIANEEIVIEVRVKGKVVASMHPETMRLLEEQARERVFRITPHYRAGVHLANSFFIGDLPILVKVPEYEKECERADIEEGKR